MSLTNFSEETEFYLKKARTPWAGRKVDREAAEGALKEHFERLSLKPYPIRWAPDGAYGYIDAFCTGGEAMGMTNDNDWLQEHKKYTAKARERVWDKRYSFTADVVHQIWNFDDDNVISRMFSNAQREMGSKLIRLPRRRPGAPNDAVVRFMAQGIAWSELYMRTSDPIADELSRIWMPFYEMYEAGVWFCWIVNKEVILVERPGVYKDAIGRFHRIDGPAIDWGNGKGVFYWAGVEVDENIVMNPNGLTIRMIDREPNIEVRRVMIERYGLDRYLEDSKAVVIHQDHRGTLLRKEQPNDEPIVVVRVKNSTAEPDGTFKDYFIRVPPTITNASHAVAWTFGIEPHEYYDPMLET